MWHLERWLSVGLGSSGLMVEMDDLKGLFQLNHSVILWLPQLDNIQLQSMGPPEGLQSWMFFKGSQKPLGSAGKWFCLWKNRGLLQRCLLLAAVEWRQSSCHRALDENEKAYLNPVVLNTLTWLFETLIMILLKPSFSFMGLFLQIINNYRSPLRWRHLRICCKSFLKVIYVLFTLSPDDFMC